jgi:hypothetical protein
MSDAKSNRMKCMVKQTYDGYAEAITIIIIVISGIVKEIQKQVSTKDKFNAAIVSAGIAIIGVGLLLVYNNPNPPTRLSDLNIIACISCLPIVSIPVYHAFYNCYVITKGKE